MDRSGVFAAADPKSDRLPGAAGVSTCTHFACETDRPCKGDFLSITKLFRLASQFKRSALGSDLIE